MTRTQHPYLDHPGPIPFAHRGGSADGLENTAAAFRLADRAGYRYFETDVHTTADGRLVAFHDATLDRMTDARGPIASLPWSEVRRARVAGTEPLPLFADLLEEFPDARWNVDIKAGPALAPLIGLIRSTGAWDRVCVGSFSEKRVAAAARLAGPRLATSYGMSGIAALRLRSYGAPAALRTGAVCAQVPEFHGRIRVVDRRFVRTAHARGLQVHVWTVNDPRRMAALLDLGVDGIMTDQLESLRTVLTARGAWN
ncbi:glycerophosphodiester phosphodiesterase [Streptomyces sp. NBC_01306]|uniref:glycerophosphodiester phosphodiesterase n=1 Tax=Streptomyces sp. NBC_01306 TaxID=2903819 RepID=UPI00224F1EAE|nr:glycerophosphodiester phosphodiesterase [Streptomyces sp. NBC_01306]MCX4727846.1 glycerophosphodiester phosphodiesterase [Streptomyces sp. NBC_01306]